MIRLNNTNHKQTFSIISLKLACQKFYTEQEQPANTAQEPISQFVIMHLEFLSVLVYKIRQKRNLMQFVSARSHFISRKIGKSYCIIYTKQKTFSVFPQSYGNTSEVWKNEKCCENMSCSNFEFSQTFTSVTVTIHVTLWKHRENVFYCFL